VDITIGGIMEKRGTDLIQSKRAAKKRYAATNQQYLDCAICDQEESTTGSSRAVTEKVLDDIEHGRGLSRVYKDMDEMFRDLGF
jgi:hypothetical protein